MSTTESAGVAGWVQAGARARARARGWDSWRLVVAFVLCAAAMSVVLLGAPWHLALVVVGSYCLFVPGLLLDHVLGLRDPLLSLVVGLMVGPSVWVLLGTLLLFLGWWDPAVTVVATASVLAVVSAGLSLVPTQSTAAHRYRSRELSRDA